VRKVLALALVAVLGGALAGALVLGARALTAPEPVAAREGAGGERVKERNHAPGPPAAAFSVPRPRPLAAHEAGSLFAPLRRAALAHATPDAPSVEKEHSRPALLLVVAWESLPAFKANGFGSAPGLR
jgi:hypothetical protein